MQPTFPLLGATHAEPHLVRYAAQLILDNRGNLSDAIGQAFALGNNPMLHTQEKEAYYQTAELLQSWEAVS